MRKLSLENRIMTVDMLPDCGGAIAALRLKTGAGAPVNLLRPATQADIEGRNLGHMSCIPLAPFASYSFGGFPDGYLRFGGVVVKLAEVANAARAQPTFWTVQDASDVRATLTWYHEPGLWGWPFGFQILQRLRLNEDGLELYMALTNIGPRPMPAGMGLRLNLDWRAGTQFRAALAGQGIPQATPFALGVSDIGFNARLEDENMQVEWGAERLALGITLGGPLQYLNLRSRRRDHRIVLQPATHFEAFGPDDRVRQGGMAILQQGDSLAGTMLLTARDLTVSNGH